MSQKRYSLESGSTFPTEQSGNVTPSIYHGETMAMTEQKTNKDSDVVGCCWLNIEGLAVSRGYNEPTFITKVGQ